MRLTPRTRAALVVERAAGAASRGLGRGSGEVVGGKLALAISPGALSELTASRAVACVSATNGKTTTTRLLAAALGTLGVSVASNSGGANMSAGVLAALSRSRGDGPAALEVDEIYLPIVARQVRPRVVALLNVSRDQLDRSNETRRIAALWRDLGAALPDTVVVANADDPMVVWAAQGFSEQRWVAAGQTWTADAMVCPACAQLLSRADGAWSCGSCGLRRPEPEAEVIDLDHVRIGETVLPVSLALPGRCNVANAAMAAVVALEMGVAPAAALAAMSGVGDVQGRYGMVPLAPGVTGRMLLAKNPAGWVEMLELLDHDSPGGVGSRPCLLGLNARTADGKDPSWIWDVPLEQLGVRPVFVFGDRAHDMSVRLAYASVEHFVHASAEEAALAAGCEVVDVVANYTAFRDLVA